MLTIRFFPFRQVSFVLAVAFLMSCGGGSATAPGPVPTPIPTPTPDPQFNQAAAGDAYNEWMPIEPVLPVSQLKNRTSGRFAPAPSASAVWYSRHATVRR